MQIKNSHLWNLMLSAEGSCFTPIIYFPYKSGPFWEDAIIAEDDHRSESDVVRIVSDVLYRATGSINTVIENKTAAMCLFSNGKEVVPVYFCIYDERHVICTRIRSDQNWIKL